MSSVLRAFDDMGTRKQWVAHDKPGGKAAQRRLRQRAALEATQRQRAFGVPVNVDGRTPAGLIVFDPQAKVAS